MKINKDKIINFINLIKQYNFLDYVSEYNINSIIDLLNKINSPNMRDLQKICNSSHDIIIKLNNIFNLFNHSFVKYKNKSLTNYSNVRKDLHHIPSYSNENSDIAQKIKQVTIKKKYVLQIDDFKVNLFFYCSSENLDETFVHNTAQIIYMFIKTFSRNNDLYKNYNFRFLLIDHPRVLNTDINQAAIDGDFNNSSGMTNIFNKELIVTRLSGFNGLLIHELLHLLGLEFCFSHKDNDYSHYEDWINDWIAPTNLSKNHGVKNLYEGICNTTSSYFLSIYNSIKLCNLKNSNNIDKLVKYFCYFFYIEFIHALIQCVRLLKSYGINKYSDFVNSNNELYHQESLMFEYIVLRYYIINDYYRLLLKRMLKQDFNDNSQLENEHFQNNLNTNILRLVNVPKLKTLFNDISNNLYIGDINYIEYFCI